MVVQLVPAGGRELLSLEPQYTFPNAEHIDLFFQPVSLGGFGGRTLFLDFSVEPKSEQRCSVICKRLADVVSVTILMLLGLVHWRPW